MRALAVALLTAPLVLLSSFIGGAGLAASFTSATSAESTAGAPTGPTSGSARSVRIATFNILGASHTDGERGSGLGGHENVGWPPWRPRLRGALAALSTAGVGIAGLQEVHAPQSRALASTYANTWAMFPRDASVADKVIWNPTAWLLTEARRVPVPYMYGDNVDTPLVLLTSVVDRRQVWVWSVHNPIGARRHRIDALRIELKVTAELASTGVPVVLVGDFNDADDGDHSSHCTLTSQLTSAFGGSHTPCRPGTRDSRIDHLYGQNVVWSDASVDRSTVSAKVSDHPLVTAVADLGP